jgi:DNA-binding transcriptional ArsR family regulator
MVKYEDSLDAVFKALGDPARRSMLARLSLGEATLGQLAEPLTMSLPAVHRHLAVLEHAGLVRCQKRGRERWCRGDPDALADALTWIFEHRRLWQQRLDALAELLAKEDSAETDRNKADRPKYSPKRRKRR